MSTVTINITMPKKLKSEVDKQVKTGFYTSVSEFIRTAIRSVLSTDTDIPYGPAFSPRAEKQILKAEKQALRNRNKNIVLKTNQDIEAFFRNL